MSQVDLKYIFEWVVKSLGSEHILSNHSTVMHHYVALVKYVVVEFTINIPIAEFGSLGKKYGNDRCEISILYP